MRLWLRRKDQQVGKHYALHEFDGEDTSCFAVKVKGMNLDNYEITGGVQTGEHICLACQTAIAERRGKF